MPIADFTSTQMSIMTHTIQNAVRKFKFPATMMIGMANGLYKTWELFSVKGREIGIHCGLILRKIELEYQNNKTV